MQPLTACELDAFLGCARDITAKNLLGNLQRLAEPFVRQPVEAALLHFIYQRARALGKDKENQEDQTDRQRSSEQIQLFQQLDQMDAVGRKYQRERLFPVQLLNRLIPVKTEAEKGQPDIQERFYAPILDLLEITKSLR